jgi:hypothetical protein
LIGEAVEAAGVGDGLPDSLAAAPLSVDSSISPEDRNRQMAAAREVVDRLKLAKPDGRVVMDVGDPGAARLPVDLVLQNNDRIVIPPRPTTVGVFGAVYRPASFLLNADHPLKVRDYIERAGGTLRAADKGQIFVVHADGAVVTKHKGALGDRVLPGDVIFVPVKTKSTSFWGKLQQISSVVFQLGLSTAAFVALAQ